MKGIWTLVAMAIVTLPVPSWVAQVQPQTSVCAVWKDGHRENGRDDLAASTRREQGAGSTGPCWQLIICSISMTPITMASESLAAPG